MIFTRLRRWIDRDMSSRGSIRGGDNFSLIIGCFVVGGGLWIAHRSHDWRGAAAAAAAAALIISLGLVWLSFVAWRMWRMVRASVMQTDRQYDHSTKNELPPEYASSESATTASQRRRERKAP